MAARSVRVPSSTCYCSARQAAHVHCFCIICNGKAVNYRTQISHLNSSAFCDVVTPTRSEEETVVLVEREIEERLDHEETVEDGHDRIDGILFLFFNIRTFCKKVGKFGKPKKRQNPAPPADHDYEM